MLCPRCQSSLEEIVYEGLILDTCKECQGEWLDDSEILLINKVREKIFSEKEKAMVKGAYEVVIKEVKQPEKPLLCPRCSAPLKVRNYGYSTGIIVDRCLQCNGLWLDKDELEHIQIVIEEWEKKTPELEAKFLPALAKIEEEQDIARRRHINEIVEERMAKRSKLIKSPVLDPLVKPLIKGILYYLF